MARRAPSRRPGGPIVCAISLVAGRPRASERVALAADAYHGGALDWYAFDRVRAPQPAGPAARSDTLSFLPTGIDFAGMPSARFWEMENGRTEFGHIDANNERPRQTAARGVVLLFSNDWCVIPLELDIGTFRTRRRAPREGTSSANRRGFGRRIAAPAQPGTIGACIY